MNREEFLQKLQEALSGEVPPETVHENLQYYSGYIRDERRKGRSEEEIMGELGDPRMIARTIIDTTPGGGSGFEEYRGGFGGFASDEYSSGERGSFRGYDNAEHRREQQMGGYHVYDLNKWYYKVLAVAALIAVFTVVIAIVSGILSLLVPLLPVIIAVMVITWFIRG